MATTDQAGEAVPAAQAPGTHHSQLEMFWKEFYQNTLSLVGSAVILTMLLTTLFTPLLAPHDPTTRFEAPDDEHNSMPIGTGMLTENSADEVVGTTTAYLGIDHHDRDILSRITCGLRMLMTVSLGIVDFAAALGVIAGAIAGYYRNTWIDEVVMRSMDILFSFPNLILVIVVISVFGMGNTEYDSFAFLNIAKVIAVIGVVYIPNFARIMRGSVLKEVEKDYIDTAKPLGASGRYILLKDIAVNTLPTVVAQGVLYTGTAILVNAALSFLGLGIQPPNANPGLVLSNTRGYLYSGERWHSVFPGLVIVVTILGFNLPGDDLRDVLDPRSNGGER